MTPRRRVWPVGLAVIVLGGGAGAGLWITHANPRPPVRSATVSVAPAKPPLVIRSEVPAAGATGVASDAGVTVTFSVPVSPAGTMPVLTPAVPGVWQMVTPTTVTFAASGPFIPGITESLTVRGGASGVRATDGAFMASTVTFTFTVAPGTLRLQQLLAGLGYLPVNFAPTGPPPAPNETAQPQPGTFSWRWANSLSGLESHWAPGDFGPLTRGAIMTFENQRGLTVDGLAGAPVWSALLQAAATGAVDPKPYDYAYVSKVLPETLTLYVNGVAQFPNIAVNTGVHGADTPDGTYPVFEHATSSEMKGTNVDGTHYDDKAVPWASFFTGGDALHGFVRASYGSPQSNGCVEMPIATAGTLWPYTPIGTLVTVVGPSS
ncbi:MAG TPA: L,D-transpeptidase family protein [Acidimicrobiales bacterium]|nr:L,D-transpeptidase family protein [Acidimicrobiales bacterium]